MYKLRLENIIKIDKEIKLLYKEAFPANERVPISILNLLARKETFKFYGIYDEKNELVGLIYNAYYKDIVLIGYFAIANKYRGRGYGSETLELLKQQYNDYRILLNIEQIDEKVSNNEQRIRRKAFYEKNGFKLMDFTAKEGTETYEFLCYSKDGKKVSKQEYHEVVRSFLGKFLFKIYKLVCK